MPYILDGRPISPDAPFSAVNVDGDLIQFPANWIRLASDDDKAAIGLTWEADPAPYDQRFQWGWTEDGEPIWKDHAELVSQWVAQTKITAASLIFPTDWMVTRSAEPNGKPVPDDVLAERDRIRALSNEKEAVIEATTSTEELAAYVNSAAYSQWAEPQMERARNADGTFRADDPNTSQDEAWVTTDAGLS